MHYELSALPNGLRIITDTMPDVRSVALGVWVDAGTRDEFPNEAGAAHFLEHLLFKGSDRLSAQQIAEAFDAVGGRSNAFTSKEQTCYWARLRDEDLPLGINILTEMVRRPAFRQNEIDSEKHVVLEEINMNEDDPTDVAYEEFSRVLWRGHDLERPVLGTRESITAMTRADISEFWARRYHAGSTVVAVAGRVDHAALRDQVEEHFGDWHSQETGHLHSPAAVEPSVAIRHRDTEQTHLVIGGEGLARGDERRYAFGLLNHVMGGGMSSRLFREIRELRGLAYSVYSFRFPYADSGGFGVYVGTTPSQTEQVLILIRDEFKKLIADGITEDELARAKGHIQGSLALNEEDPNSRMIRLGRDEIAGQEHLSLDEALARYDAVTLDDVHQVAGELLSGPKVIGATGPHDAAELEPYVV
ncbi:MAG: insulinase family protein [Acidimicrobiia bacterium]|nr:insulinase family protein [Acidimicrobiia bacterium]